MSTPFFKGVLFWLEIVMYGKMLQFPSRQRKTSLIAQSDYEASEARMFHAQLREPDKNSLADRREACSEFLETMRSDPDIIGERIGWLFSGEFGFGAQRAAISVLHSGGRSNKAAQLTQMIAALDFQCPVTMSAKSWKKLSAGEKKALDKEIQAAIRDAATADLDRPTYNG